MIAGLGCAFRLTVTSGDVETIFVPVSAGSVCSMTQNMQNAYTSIEAVDWESDMVFGMATTRVTINSADADNYTMVTGCVPPSELILYMHRSCYAPSTYTCTCTG